MRFRQILFGMACMIIGMLVGEWVALVKIEAALDQAQTLQKQRDDSEDVEDEDNPVFVPIGAVYL